jgi:hypothetical protein
MVGYTEIVVILGAAVVVRACACCEMLTVSLLRLRSSRP